MLSLFPTKVLSCRRLIDCSLSYSKAILHGFLAYHKYDLLTVLTLNSFLPFYYRTTARPCLRSTTSQRRS